ncbi:4-diphosphocytidyl-2-C-methyl-D-erythritol kinase [Sphingomonas sp. BE138]|uniref:4-(cytidine 5'-diphospho)-2-C-methyl-D-erythritol kinase n=1 Tax=Sphingomonas sp. BE138 TaxID=2817845 RepID=UPI002864E035|nr:4-(cytidine 5'-diphospho)-2-C-methyl-D-erythritol kinase [Sphingomonas sp. BE138]MDR6786752.1 4-diphosphocytidyl-2-C-methyl-D-erythritol kinase [Sphingomonas sp. BE138]
MPVEVAPAKLNLALHVRARRADGYHELETLFVFARDGDTVTVERADAPSFAVTGPFAAAVGPDGDNLVTRAERAFRDTFGLRAAHAIVLDKHLPVASGIGGGSADAAATLRALATIHGVADDDARLMAIAARLGADVPACLLGRPTLGSGRGDALVPVAGLGDMPALLVNPLVAVSTAAVFAGWDGVDRGALPGEGTTLARALAGRNDLQAPAESVAPVIRDVLAVLAACDGVVMARMSGSGATCFALFDEAARRDSAAAIVAHHAPRWWRMATTIG